MVQKRFVQNRFVQNRLWVILVIPKPFLHRSLPVSYGWKLRKTTLVQNRLLYVRRIIPCVPAVNGRWILKTTKIFVFKIFTKQNWFSNCKKLFCLYVSWVRACVCRFCSKVQNRRLVQKLPSSFCTKEQNRWENKIDIDFFWPKNHFCSSFSYIGNRDFGQ